MKRFVLFFSSIFFLFIVTFSLSGHATSYTPFAEEHRLLKEKTLMKPGALVYLFHGGIHDLKKSVPVGDTLFVFRRGLSCEIKKVGRIRVLSYAGDNYVKGEVVEGEIRLDDIAQAGPSALLIVFPDSRCAQ